MALSLLNFLWLTPVRTSLSLLCTLRGLALPYAVVTRVLSLSLEFWIPGGQEACFFHFYIPLEHGAWKLLITLNYAAYLRSRKPSIIAFTSFLISSMHKEFFEGNFLISPPIPGHYGFCYRQSPHWAHLLYAQNSNGAANPLLTG